MMDDFSAKGFTEFLGIMEKLKCQSRHCCTSSGRAESVAEHSWRLAVMPLLLEERFPDVDIDKVIRMTLVHDWGEAMIGDVPAFEKTAVDAENEKQSLRMILDQLPENVKCRTQELLDELERNESKEARLCHALDKLEALIQHNEAGADTWADFEADLQMTYGVDACNAFPLTKHLRDYTRDVSKVLLRNAHKESK